MSSISHINIAECGINDFTAALFMYGLTLHDEQREVYAYTADLHQKLSQEIELAAWMETHASAFQVVLLPYRKNQLIGM